MKGTEFCYWLQGALELNPINQINERQAKIIAAHLKMVEIHDKSDGRARQFCKWLQSAILMFGEVEFSEGQTAVVKKTLSEVFLHEIDPSYPAEEIQQLNETHGSIGWSYGPIWWNRPPGAKC